MKKVLFVLSALTAIAPAVSASAATISGTVKSVDSSHDAITLKDGSIYTLAEGSEAEDFKPGTNVMITYDKKNGKNVASSVKMSK